MPADQKTDEWLIERLGKITGSMYSKVLGGAVGRRTYLMELATEILTSEVRTFESNATRYGTESEDEAKRQYEFETGNVIEETGFILHPSYDFTGVSPDGLIGDEGGVEFKCPYNPTYHTKTVVDGMPKEHKAQVQGALWVTGRQWWDFVSYCPKMPVGKQLYVERQYPDGAYLEELENKVLTFKSDLDIILEKFMSEE